MTVDAPNATGGPSGPYGADVSAAVSEGQWEAIAGKDDIGFAIVRCYRNAKGGTVDASCPATVTAAWTSGISAVDVYHFPIRNAKTPEQQVGDSLEALGGVNFGRYWLDVEEPDWDADGNVEFIGRLVNAVRAAGKQPGIYTGTSAWKGITGGTTDFSALPLWWVSHGETFAPFGGWEAPLIVQLSFNLTVSVAHEAPVEYDLDQMWSPED
jgi:hypothetical protein